MTSETFIDRTALHEMQSLADPGTEAEQASGPDTGAGWDLRLIVVSVYILTSVGRIHQLFGALEPFHLAVVSALASVGLLLANRDPARQIGTALATPLPRWMIALFAWSALSVPGAVWPGGAFAQVLEFGKALGMSLVVVAAVRHGRDVARLATVYFVSAAVYAVVVLGRFHVGGGDDWRLANLMYYDANDFAAFAVSAIPLGLYVALRRGPVSARVAAIVGIGALGVSFIWAGSRGGFLASLVAGVYFLFRFKGVRASRRLFAVGVAAAGLASTASPEFWAQMRTIAAPQGDYNVTGETGRWEVWKRGIGYMVTNPIVGVGAGDFNTAEGMLSSLASRAEYGTGVKWSEAHNTYVQVGAELGIPGLLIFLGMLLGVFRALSAATRVSRAPDTFDADRDLLAQSMSLAFVGFLVGAFFLSLAYREPLYTLLALAAALEKVTRSRPMSSP
jgi:O-antigen ligase